MESTQHPPKGTRLAPSPSSTASRVTFGLTTELDRRDREEERAISIPHSL